jgi:hypothetical protein
MMFLKGCLTQETEKPQIPIVVKVAEQWLNKLKNQLNDYKPEKREVRLPQVWTMIENVHTMNTVKHKQEVTSNFKWIT